MFRYIISISMLFFATQLFAASPVVKTYSVEGITVDDVITSIETNDTTPEIEPGKKAWGWAEQTWSYKALPEKGDDGWKTKTASVTRGKAVMHMPSWKQYKKAKACLKKNWDFMWTNLKIHEEGHFKIGDPLAKEMEKAILAVSGQPSDKAWKDKTAEIFNELISRNNSAQKAYDDSNKHGSEDEQFPVVLNDC